MFSVKGPPVRVRIAFDMDVVDKIADLILQDPSISVRELARRLGYAEEKTVYYWLSKQGYRGIRPFKRAVLTGQYRASGRARETSSRLGRLPIADRLSSSGDPLFTGASLPVTLDRGRGLYVFHYSGPAVHGLLPGDYIVVGPLDWAQAEWVIVQTAAGTVELRRVVRTDAGPLLFDPQRADVDREATPRGTVLQVVRVLRPAHP
jgi:transposase-like protein